MNKLLRLDQITAETSEDPLEKDYLCNPIDDMLIYSLGFFMGYQYGELDIKTPLNTIEVRSSMVKLFSDCRWALLPTQETMQALAQLHEENLRCRLYERKFYTEVFPHQEYEYVLLPLVGLDCPLFIIQDDGTRIRFDPPFDELPHFRASLHPFFAMRRAVKHIIRAMSRGFIYRSLEFLTLMRSWSRIPGAWSRTPNWKKLGHPLDNLDIDSETKCEAVPEATRSAPAILFQPPGYSPPPTLIHGQTLSTAGTVCSLKICNPKRYIQHPALERWVVDVKKGVEKKVYTDHGLLNDKQVLSYRKEKGRSYEEVMKTSGHVPPLSLLFRKELRYSPYRRTRRS
ncbi:hypothetical protein E1B28_001933 [Marasmius oreades]|uniref:Uncharacterized protein n=1 Tax=Marasmius oreades TaxID=181124 RepID=A0A9P8AFZ4_9AGAR|nr:uncharacterized protein E1B28_001933 [Marasmius oreades]KAG7100154.1 hypothetical protein E1B28_001933 [Marasmius oreades]